MRQSRTRPVEKFDSRKACHEFHELLERVSWNSWNSWPGFFGVRCNLCLLCLRVFVVRFLGSRNLNFQGQTPIQNSNRSIHWMILAKPSVPVIRPNWGFPNTVFGALNLGVLVAFKASTRNETRVLSLRFTALRTERSMLATPGPRQSPSRRGT